MNNRVSTAVRPLLYLYCLSGLVSLGYQIAWFRIYADRFGSSSLTFLLVLTCFIGGLGFGAIGSARVTAWIQRQLPQVTGLQVYGLVEILIATLVLLTVVSGWLPASPWGAFPYVLDDGVFVPSAIDRLSRLFMAIVCVLVPSFFMGVTYPLLCQLMRAQPRFPSRLYAWNTLGACTGVLLCQFVAIHQFGHDWTLAMLVALNLALGGYFVCLGGGARLTGPVASSSPAVTGGVSLVVLGGLSGLLTGSLEGDLFKRLWFLGTNSGAAMAFISFWAILGIFLASATVTRWQGLRLLHIKIALAVATVVYMATWKLAYPLRGWFRDQYAERLSGAIEVSTSTADVLPSALQTDLVFTFVFVGVFAFPAIYLISLLLPFVCNAARGDQKLLGRVYGVNTLAFCVGMVGFVWLAPRVDIFFSLKLIMVLLVVGTLTLCVLDVRARRPLRTAVIGLVVFALAALLTPRGYDRAALDPARQAYHYPVRALKSNGAHTTYVVQMPRGDALYFDSHPMSATDLEAQIYMRLMAHFPLLAQEDPETALLIGFGVGNTAAAIAAHGTMERIDIVDLNRKVIDTAPEFESTNDAVYADPRVRFINDDGRRFLDLTRERYDLITSEPPPPLQDGVYRLYSREYYEAALAKLTPGGMLTQWLPVSQLSATTTALMVATFQRVFPETLMFSGYGAQLILVGAREPIDLARLERNLAARPRISADLHRLRMPAPEHVLGRIVMTDAHIDAEYADRAVISDRRNDLAYQVAAPLSLTRLGYDPLAVLEALEQAGVTAAASLRPVLPHLGRLFYRLPDFPLNWLKVEVSPDGAPVALADADWAAVVRLYDQYRVAMLRSELERAESLLREALQIGPEQPLLLLALGRVQLTREAYAAAVQSFERLLRLEPDDAAAYLNLSHALRGSQDHPGALAAAERAVALAPDSPWGYRARGLVHIDAGRPLRALEDYEHALRLAPDAIELLAEKGALVERLATGGSN